MTAPFESIQDGVSLEIAEKPIEDAILISCPPKLNFFSVSSSKSIEETIEEEIRGDHNDSDYIYPEDFDDATVDKEPVIENEFELPVSVYEKTNESIEGLTDSIRNLLLTKSCAAHMAYDIATAQTEAVIRDDFGVDVSIDSQPVEYINLVTDLELLNVFMKNAELSKSIRANVMSTFIEQMVSDTVNRVTRARTSGNISNKFRHTLENMKSKTSDQDTGRRTNPVGSVALNTRS